MANGESAPQTGWTFLTNHAHILVALHRNPDLRQQELGDAVGIALSSVQRILAELEDEGYLSHQRIGRRNSYRIDYDQHLRHPIEADRTIAELLTGLEP